MAKKRSWRMEKKKPTEIRKITTGFVIQRWDKKTGKFLGQEFVAGDEVDYEDEFGKSIDDEEPEYREFEMVQDPPIGDTYLTNVDGK